MRFVGPKLASNSHVLSPLCVKLSGTKLEGGSPFVLVGNLICVMGGTQEKYLSSIKFCKRSAQKLPAFISE